MQGLRDVPGQEVVANVAQTLEEAREFGRTWQIPHQHDDTAELCEREDVDLVVIGVPNHVHLEAVRIAAQAGKDMVVAKPLGRNAQEAAEMVRLAREANVMAAYAETEVFSPSVMRARALIEQGAIGDVLTVRSREGHSGPHAAHFWNAEQAGGGSLMDMGCHTIEVARYFIGKDVRPDSVIAWGDTLMHRDKTTGEDNGILLLRFEDGRVAVSETSWTTQGGMELRNEVYGTGGRIVTDSRDSAISAFTTVGAGYIQEKADVDTGWIFPIPDEARVYGYQEEMRHFVECKATGAAPRESFCDGYVVNAVLDAGYRSIKSGHWEKVELEPMLLA
jgi:predicted dehydrogenase